MCQCHPDLKDEQEHCSTKLTKTVLLWQFIVLMRLMSVDLLDQEYDWNRDEGMSELDPAMEKYYRDVQNSTKDLKNCY